MCRFAPSIFSTRDGNATILARESRSIRGGGKSARHSFAPLRPNSFFTLSCPHAPKKRLISPQQKYRKSLGHNHIVTPRAKQASSTSHVCKYRATPLPVPDKTLARLVSTPQSLSAFASTKQPPRYSKCSFSKPLQSGSCRLGERELHRGIDCAITFAA